MINASHDPGRRSWVETANHAGADFPLQNLPHGIFSTSDSPARGGVAIGDSIVDLGGLVQAGVFDKAGLREVAQAAAEPQLNALMASDSAAVSALRERLQQLLEAGSSERSLVERELVPMTTARLHIPANIRAFTDFMTSAWHINAPRPARPEGGPLPPCFWRLPIAYNSRASSIVPSGIALERPYGQFKADDSSEFGPTRALDFELEFACFLRNGNPLGRPVHVDRARGLIFGYCLLNDWSARDVQFYESVLGPFQGKAFRTTISPWVVTAEAMAPFRKPMPARPADAPAPPVHLKNNTLEQDGGLAIRFEAHLLTAQMRAAGQAPQRVTATDFDSSAWSFEQMIAHHAIGGCNMQTADLVSSGTLSGKALEAAACLLEITGGKAPVQLPDGETRLWLQDGDELLITGRAEREGFRSIGFGSCTAVIAPAVDFTP